MSARDQELIARLERIRSLSLKDIGERFFFCFGLGDLEWEGKCKMFAKYQFGW